MRVTWTPVLVACATLATPAFCEGGHELTDDACGVAVTLPSRDWTLRDESAGPIVGHIYSPDPSIVPRFSLIVKPRALAPAGMEDRARELSTGSRALEMTDATFAGVRARRIEWVEHGVRGIEYGMARGGVFLVVQVAAIEAAWKDPEQARPLHAILDSVRLVPVKGADGVVKVDPSTPAQVHAARAAAAPRRCAIRSHDVQVDIRPAERRLACRDTLRVEALEGGVDTFDLRTYHVRIDSLRLGGVDLPHEPLGAEKVRVRLPKALLKGEVATLEFTAHSDDYFVAATSAIVELAVLGQVRAESTWSSHVFYYPIDAENDAELRLSITVPKPYVAVSGGVAEPARDSGEGTGATTTRGFKFVARPRLMPAGFAVAKYARLDAATKGGVALEMYFWPGEEARAKRFLEVAVRAGGLFEERMGPLPWGRVAFCHIRPERKEMGVSLPGLVLFSDHYLHQTVGADLRGIDVAFGRADGMIVVDELGHQWNAYAAPYPNELAEGISTYLCLLHTERQAGEAEYRSGLRSVAEIYLDEAEREEDVALANPRIGASPIYRAVAFAKTAAVLGLLRQRLGDAKFFAGWRAAFASPPAGRALGYADFRRAFETASGEDLGQFFDQWFFRAGHPRLRIAWKAVEADARPAMQVKITQDQPGEPFEFPLELDVQGGDGDVRHTVVLRGREETFTLKTRGPPVGVTLDPRGRALLVRELGR